MVLVDEYQDLSPVNRAMVGRLCKHSRQIGVGDEAQAIYEFRGADVRAMPDAIEQFGMETLPFNHPFVVPDAITDNVHWHVPDIRHPNLAGWLQEEMFNQSKTTPQSSADTTPTDRLGDGPAQPRPQVDVAGVDIGARIIRLLTKLGSEDMTNVQVLSAIEHWEAERESLDNKNARDTAECMRVFAATARPSVALSPTPNISSKPPAEPSTSCPAIAPKAWNSILRIILTVNQLKRGIGQESNIHYVIDTRAKEKLIYIRATNGID